MSNNNNEYECYVACESSCTFTLFSQQLIAALKETNYNGLINFLNQLDCRNFIKLFPHEVLTTIVSVMHSKQNLQNKILYTCCEKVLYYLAIYCEPSELLLYFIEQMELSNLDHCFFSFLNPLKICLFRCKNPLLVIDMCIDNVKKFLLHLPLPNNEDNNKTCDILERIILSYINISNFVDNLLHDLQLSFLNNKNVQSKIKYLILDLLLSLFDKPISYINFNCNNHQLLFEKILRNILLIECDVIYFFRFIDHGHFYKYCISSNKEKRNRIDDNEQFLKVNDLSLCNFYWTILCKVLDIRILKIYNPHYIAYNCINMSNYLMMCERERSVTIIKGLDLVSYALNIIKKFLIPFEALDLLIHNELIQNLTYFIIYNNSTHIQKYALNNFIEYIYGFCDKGKYTIVNKLISLDYHSRIKGFVIGIIKNIIADSLTSFEKHNASQENFVFLGQNLQLIISKICILRHGTNTDLLEISDQLIVILNFIIFLIIRDKKTSGIINFFKKTNFSFLRSIKIAVETQKTQWFWELDNLDKNKHLLKLNETKEMFTEGLEFIPMEQKFQMCSQAINTLLIIENILYRIYELIDIKFLNMYSSLSLI